MCVTASQSADATRQAARCDKLTADSMSQQPLPVAFSRERPDTRALPPPLFEKETETAWWRVCIDVNLDPATKDAPAR